MDSATADHLAAQGDLPASPVGGIGLGLYVLLISVTGSILVYRNELYRAATPDPVIVTRRAHD